MSIKNAILFITLFNLSVSSWGAPACVDLLKRITTPANNSILSPRDLKTPTKPVEKSETKISTKLELITKKNLPTLEASELLVEKIKDLEKTNPQLAQKVRQARELKRKGTSILVDTSHLQGHMINFLEGAFKRVVGSRGLSAPFVSFEAPQSDMLIIRHEGDAFPLMVKWTLETDEPKTSGSTKYKGQIYQVLELPAEFKSKQDLSELSDKYIYGLIAGSSLNRFINAKSTDIMTIAAILHDGKIAFDRPTQTEAKQVRNVINGDPELRSNIRSLLFVAPTASGKTKVLTDALSAKVKAAADKIKSGQKTKKLTILMTKTPDLTSDLAVEVGRQLNEEFNPKDYRIIQWGGRLSEDMTHEQMIKFIKDSDVPVVLVTSYPTLGIRSKHSQQKLELMQETNALLVDEAHNATGNVFKSVMQAATEVAASDRKSGNLTADALDIFGVTASPITREQRTIEVYDATFWAGIDKPGVWSQRVKKGQVKPKNVLEWSRIVEQYQIARERGEINGSDPLFFKPEDFGFNFSSIFKRSESGTHSSVNIEKLKQIWPLISGMVEGHGPGVIKTYPRDADLVAKTLSEESGKNYVSLQSLSDTARAEVYQAFRDQTPYKGRVVDAIVVGRVIEGLDFPKAGWFLSFKKYVKFPENIQDPGRVVRLAHNKLSPKIIFFGEEVDKTAYKDVRELIMRRLGKLPRQTQEASLFSGRKNNNISSELSNAIDDANVAMEAFLRTNPELARHLSRDGAMNAEILPKLRELILDIRSSGENREISKAVKNLLVQLNSYSFFTGRLDETWNLCDRLISLEKKGADAIKRSRLSDLEKSILKNKELMAQVKEFRSLLASFGIIPRQLLAGMTLRPLNLTELAASLNAYVDKNNEAPIATNLDPKNLKTLTDEVVQNSPDQLWRRLNNRSRAVLKDLFDVQSQVSFEQALSDFVRQNGKMPEFTFDIVDDPSRSTADYVGHKLADEFIYKLREGDLIVSQLDPHTLSVLDNSTLFNGIMIKAVQAVKKIKQSDAAPIHSGIARLVDSGLLTYENLMRYGEMRILRSLKDLAELDPSGESAASHYYREINELLNSQ